VECKVLKGIVAFAKTAGLASGCELLLEEPILNGCKTGFAKATADLSALSSAVLHPRSDIPDANKIMFCDNFIITPISNKSKNQQV
jgi:hypothetical protein